MIQMCNSGWRPLLKQVIYFHLHQKHLGCYQSWRILDSFQSSRTSILCVGSKNMNFFSSCSDFLMHTQDEDPLGLSTEGTRRDLVETCGLDGKSSGAQSPWHWAKWRKPMAEHVGRSSGSSKLGAPRGLYKEQPRSPGECYLWNGVGGVRVTWYANELIWFLQFLLHLWKPG